MTTTDEREAQCNMPNCRNRAPAHQAFCAQHRPVAQPNQATAPIARFSETSNEEGKVSADVIEKAPPAGEVAAWLDTLRDAFMTSQSNGHPDASERSYRLTFSFPNMDALHAAHAAMVHAFRKAELCSIGASDASDTGGAATATTDAPQSPATGGDAVERIQQRIAVFASMKPEEDEEWESWYHAAFDMLSAEAAALRPVPRREG